MAERKEVGFVGLGRMGANMVARMLKSAKIDVVVWNRSSDPVKKAVEEGAQGSTSIEDLIGKFKQDKKIIWLMLPAGEITEAKFQEVLELLTAGDIIIDGANSKFTDTLRRHEEAGEKDIEMLDVGVSGGIIAAERGYPMMIGGKEDTYEFVRPIFESFGIEEGYGLVGAPGAGHYVKMIHNAIEYGMMQSIAEGFNLLENGRFDNLNLEKITHIWNHGTIISSFLMEMVENALANDSRLESLKPYVDDSGEGRWASTEAIEQAIPFVANTYALHARFASRDKNSFANRMLAAVRHEFGGHPVKK